METLSFILIFVLTLSTLFFVYQYRHEKKLRQNLLRQIKTIEGETEDEFFKRSKFSELGLMSAGITHEISNPLSVILGRTQIMQRRIMSPEDLETGLDQIQASAQRISKTIQSVREYIYRNEADEDDFIPLKDVASKVIVFYGQRLKNHGIELRMRNLDKIFISGHRGQFEQAILNLVSNSFDAVDKLSEKWIEISARKEGHMVQIYIEDSGGGISPEVREKIFDPFFTTKKGKGSGLGLSLVRSVATKHGGDFKYIEAPHTTFMLELPKATSHGFHMAPSSMRIN